MSRYDDEGDPDLRITADDPKVSIETTTAEDDHWLANGTISFLVRRGNKAVGALEFPFEDAVGENAAIQQGLDQLNVVLRELSLLSQRLSSP